MSNSDVKSLKQLCVNFVVQTTLEKDREYFDIQRELKEEIKLKQRKLNKKLCDEIEHQHQNYDTDTPQMDKILKLVKQGGQCEKHFQKCYWGLKRELDLHALLSTHDKNKNINYLDRIKAIKRLSVRSKQTLRFHCCVVLCSFLYFYVLFIYKPCESFLLYLIAFMWFFLHNLLLPQVQNYPC